MFEYVPYYRQFKIGNDTFSSSYRKANLFELNADTTFKELYTVNQRPDKIYFVVLDSSNRFYILSKNLGFSNIVETHKNVTSVHVKSGGIIFTSG
jgi:hypothetical protein